MGFTVPALKPTAPVPEKAKVVIIGGGIMGLALAWNLTLEGETDVVVIDKGYLCAGASGRNGGGIRAQWGTPTLISLARRSIELMERFARDMGINVWFRQGGYLFLAKSDEVVKRIEKSATLHNAHGVPTQILTPDAARDVVPQLTMKGIKAAAWNPKDAVIFPWPFVWGYANQAQKKGVKVDDAMNDELKKHVVKEIGALARPDDIRFTEGLPKTRGGRGDLLVRVTYRPEVQITRR
jgi:sarcosine oxidase subunit beta